MLIELHPQDATNQLVDSRAVPPAVHITLAQADAALAENSRTGLGVLDLNIDIGRAVQRDAGSTQKASQSVLRRFS